MWFFSSFFYYALKKRKKKEEENGTYIGEAARRPVLGAGSHVKLRRRKRSSWI